MNDDIAHDLTNKILYKLERRIYGVYSESEDTAYRILKQYMDGIQWRDEELRNKYASGEMDMRIYRAERRRLLFSGAKWNAVLERLSGVYTKALKTAFGMLADVLPEVYSINAAYTEYCVEIQSGIDVNGGIYTEQDARMKMDEESDIISIPSVDESKDGRWNRQRITAKIMHGISKDISTEDLSECIRDVTDGAFASAVGTVRAIITEAENGGRQYIFYLAADANVPLEKKWDAVEDHRVRFSHKEADGQITDLDKRFIVGGEMLMYPGDPAGSAWNTKNCRCRMVISSGGGDIGVLKPENYEKWLKRKGG